MMKMTVKRIVSLLVMLLLTVNVAFAAAEQSQASEQAQAPEQTAVHTQPQPDASAVSGDVEEIAIVLDAPDTLRPGENLTVTASFENVSEDILLTAQWYLDGEPVPGYGNDNFLLTPDRISVYRRNIAYSRDMSLSHTVGFSLVAVNDDGEDETMIAYTERVIQIENYTRSHYDELDTARVLDLVTSEYKGDYTSEYSIDYETYEKEIFVNAKGYSSETQYLIWVSLSCQRVNIFEGSKGNWTLIRTGRVATGKPSTPTPRVVTKTTYKQPAWNYSNYYCKPIVRFYVRGYAFHSRLYRHDGTFYDESIGFPVSLGCVRMMDEDIQWMYDYVPADTCVVIY